MILVQSHNAGHLDTTLVDLNVQDWEGSATTGTVQRCKADVRGLCGGFKELITATTLSGQHCHVCDRSSG
jgi:hypothetical protein